MKSIYETKRNMRRRVT